MMAARTRCQRRGVEPVVHRVGPRRRRVDPPAVTAEPVGVDRRATSAFLVSGGPGPIRQDREQPRAERGPALESLEAAQHRDPRVLGHVLGFGPAADEGPGHSHEGGVVTVDQRGKGALVTVARLREELAVVGHGPRLDIAGRGDDFDECGAVGHGHGFS